jgi:hypothetical protein
MCSDTEESRSDTGKCEEDGGSKCEMDTLQTVKVETVTLICKGT